MPRAIAAETLHHLLEQGSTLALLDVREHGEYNTAHIPGASALPRRLLEFTVEQLVPWKGVQVVVCCDTGRRSALAAVTLESMGYRRVAVLEGGVNGWAADGLVTEWGMNVPSKDFGEKVEVVHHVPTIDARELARRKARGDDLVIVDTRTPEEYHRANIPGGASLPGGELAYRITDVLAERPNATVVVNCAGRTRSIIGARTLQRMGLPGVVSLRNGTSGWVLAGLELERGADRSATPEPSASGRAAAESYALRVAGEDGVQWLDIGGLDEMMAQQGDETVYLVDVRREPEYVAGHLPGFRHMPGGQAVQRCDDVAAVRNGGIIFACDGVARAGITASWFRQLGFPNVYALRGGTAAWQAAGRSLIAGTETPEPEPLQRARAAVPALAPSDVAARLDEFRDVLFVDTSAQFARSHIPGSRWIPRGWLELWIERLALSPEDDVLITDSDGSNALLAAATLKQLGYGRVWALAGGMDAWQQHGFPCELGLSGVMSPPEDMVPAGPDRSHADMINYLRWEEALGHKYEARSAP